MFKREVAINAVLYVLNRMGGICDMHKCAKILYFSDMEHLSVYGKSITGDTYIAMEFGPVPSKIYDMEKAVKGDSFYSDQANDIRANLFHFINKKDMQAIGKPDMDFLSESNVEILDKWIEELRDKSFDEIVYKSHGYAYSRTKRNHTISMTDILTERGDTEEYINYVKSQNVSPNLAFA